MIRKLFDRLTAKLARRNSESYIRWLRKVGVVIGENCAIYSPSTTCIDITRPSLLEIGNDVHITRGCVILIHGFDWCVLRNLYREVLASSGKVTIRDNVFIGMNSIILRGVTIGENSIIGAGSLVNKSVAPGSVVAGNPARLICTIDEYYHKRKGRYAAEAKAYARSIQARFHRRALPEDFWEEFPLFLKKEDLENTRIPVRHQLGKAYDDYKRSHVPLYGTFDEFLKDAAREE